MSDGPDDKDEREEAGDLVPERLHDVVLPEPPSEEDIDARLSVHKKRFDEARQKQEELRPKSALDPETSRGMGLGLSAAYAIIGLPLAGALLGWLADQAAGTQVFIMIGVLLGGIGGVAFAVHLTNRQ